MQLNLNELILRFFRDDIGGILITDAEGNILYCDGKSSFIQREKPNWAAACPAACLEGPEPTPHSASSTSTRMVNTFL